MAVVEKECSCLIGPGVDTLPGTLVSCGCPPTNTRYPPNGQEVQFPQSDDYNAQTKSILTRAGTRLFKNWRLIEYLKEATRSARLGTRSVLGAAGKFEI